MTPKLECPYCHSEDVQTRSVTKGGDPSAPLIIRKRLCRHCGGSHETLEMLDRPLTLRQPQSE